MSSPELTTTSYAILGLLAVQPWSTYELAQQMDRALGWFWPRTRSKLYEEPKKLVASGFAEASVELVGRRKRTVYSITAKGRRALAAWIQVPGDGPVMEFEHLVKVFFAEHGTKEDLRAGFAALRSWLDERAVRSAEVPREYLEGRGRYPERLPWLILTGKFLDEFEVAVERWLEWATATVESWPDDIKQAAPDMEVLAAMAARSDAVLEEARRRGAP